jgi:ABC-2 type transport system permease protein
MTDKTHTDQLVQQAKAGRPRRLKAMIKKETLQIIRDPSSILVSFVLPMLLLFLYGFGVSLDLDHLRVGLAMEDTSPDARTFAESLVDSRYFEVTIARDRRELLPLLAEGAIRGFVVVPEYFSQFRRRPDVVAPIQVVADGSETNTAVFVQNYVSGAFNVWLQQEAISDGLKGLPRVIPTPRYWYNEQLESRNFLIPGSLGIIMTLIGVLLTGLVVAREWERGTMEALMSTTLGAGELIIGKLIPYFLLGLVSMTICVVIATLGYGVPLRGSWWLVGIVTCAFLLTTLSLGLLISTLARNQFVAAQVSLIVGFLPAYVLSGFIFEISSMPGWIQVLTYFMPARYFVQNLQTLFLVGNVWSLILRNLAPQLILACLFFALTARKTVKRLD